MRCVKRTTCCDLDIARHDTLKPIAHERGAAVAGLLFHKVFPNNVASGDGATAGLMPDEPQLATRSGLPMAWR
jgi:hypothetical protein